MYKLLNKYFKKEFVKQNNFEESVVFSSFFDRPDFRLPTKDLHVSAPCLRKVVKELIKVFASKDESNHSKFSLIHLHNTETGRKQWEQFIEDVLHVKLDTSVSLRALPLKLKFSQKLSLSTQIIKSYSLLLWLKRRYKGNANILAIPELLSVYYKLERILCEDAQVYYTGVYEPESNIISYALIKKGIKVNYFTSGTPLYKYLSKLYCHHLYLSNSYQLEELNLFKTIVINKSFVLPPMSYKSLELNKSTSKSLITIGLYSNGVWKRKASNIYYDPEVERKEIELYRLIGKFSAGYNSDFKFKFYMHPVEKRNKEDIDYAKKYYSQFFGDTRMLEFVSPEISTTKDFCNADVAIAIISNTIFERLYAGYKTLIFRNPEDIFPSKETNLFHISFSSLNELEVLIAKVETMSAGDYFNYFNLGPYTYSN